MDITNSIKNGKKDWEKVSQKILKEAADLGNSAAPSDVSPNASVQGGNFDTVQKTHDQLTASTMALRDLPGYKQVRELLQPLMSASKKKNIVKTVRQAMLAKEQGEDMVAEIEDTVEQFTIDRQQAVKAANNAIKQFNALMQNAIKRHQRTIGAQWTALPQVKSAEDFENFVINSNTGLNFLNLIFPDAKQGLELNEASREKNNVRSVDAKSDAGVNKDVNALYNWLRGQQDEYDSSNKLMGLNYYKMILGSLQDAVKEVYKLKVYEALEKGFQEKLQRIKASRAAAAKKSGGEPVESDEEIFVLVGDFGSFGLSDEETESLKLDIKKIADAAMKSKDDSAKLAKDVPVKGNNVTAQEDPNLYESSSRGPGKVYAPKKSIVEEKTACDVASKKKKSINENWKKYQEKNKNAPNNEKPDDFTLLMG